MNQTSPIPLYHVIASALQRRIDDGEYEPGVPLPTEQQLAAEFEVSRATIRQAVGELVSMGMLSRRRGSGTYLEPNAQQRIGQRFQGSLGDLRAEISRTSIRDVVVEHDVPIPRRIADLLKLHEPVGTTVQRTRTIDGRAFAFTHNYLPSAHGTLLTEAELGRQSLMALLESKGVQITGARQSIRAQTATFELSRGLDLPYSGAPVLFVERLLTGPDVRPVQLVHTWYRSDIYEYTVSFDFGDGGAAGALGQLA